MNGGVQADQVHTDLIRMTLMVDICQAYWEHRSPDIRSEERVTRAFADRWFGNRSMDWLGRLLGAMARRFDAFPAGLAALHIWRPSDPAVRQIICHWHMQLADPLYRGFSGEWLLQRRLLTEPVVDLERVARWLDASYPGRWSIPTTRKLASKLISSATEAGLVTGKGSARQPVFPNVPDAALAYGLYLLRDCAISGSLLENPYLASVGLTDAILERRLTRVPGLSFRRMGALVDWHWEHADVVAWADGTRAGVGG
jgi:hypothetical protein